MLNKEAKKKLLQIAKKSIEEYLNKKKLPCFDVTEPDLLQTRGVFVTLHTKDGNLRGCIGHMVTNEPLYKVVSEMAIESASNDSRFSPVTKQELKDLNIEISILTLLRKIKSVNEIKLGTHGVLIKRGFNSGVFLPQVAKETGWSLEEFLSNLCSGKAGLSEDAWKDKDTEIFIFEVEIVSEVSNVKS
ncbi:MAG: AmmeMemoRadiSam system protein A [Candidatus Firestonebacteria bacterium]